MKKPAAVQQSKVLVVIMGDGDLISCALFPFLNAKGLVVYSCIASFTKHIVPEERHLQFLLHKAVHLDPEGKAVRLYNENARVNKSAIVNMRLLLANSCMHCGDSVRVGNLAYKPLQGGWWSTLNQEKPVHCRECRFRAEQDHQDAHEPCGDCVQCGSKYITETYVCSHWTFPSDDECIQCSKYCSASRRKRAEEERARRARRKAREAERRAAAESLARTVFAPEAQDVTAFADRVAELNRKDPFSMFKRMADIADLRKNGHLGKTLEFIRGALAGPP